MILAILPLIAILISLAILFSLARPRFLPEHRAEARDLSIIIPARDEEENIAALLQSLRAQDTRPHEIIVIDDQSSDDTARVARSLGATVIAGSEMPSGWKGKTWACQQGAEAATGDWLLFLDADTTLLPGALGRLAALTSQKTTHSVCPYHRVRKPYEQLSSYFNAITLAGVDAFALTAPAQSSLFGQVLLIPRDHYDEAGGHRAVKAEILENFQLARHLLNLKLPIRHYLGKGSIEMRMFPEGLSQLTQSWQKGFLAGASQAARRALLTTSLWLTGGMILIGCLVSIPFLPASYLQTTLAAYLAYALLSHFAFRLAGNFSFLTALFFPLPLLFYQYLFFKSLLDQKKGNKAVWKGRVLE